MGVAPQQDFIGHLASEEVGREDCPGIAEYLLDRPSAFLIEKALGETPVLINPPQHRVSQMSGRFHLAQGIEVDTGTPTESDDVKSLLSAFAGRLFTRQIHQPRNSLAYRQVEITCRDHHRTTSLNPNHRH